MAFVELDSGVPVPGVHLQFGGPEASAAEPLRGSKLFRR